MVQLSDQYRAMRKSICAIGFFIVTMTLLVNLHPTSIQFISLNHGQIIVECSMALAFALRSQTEHYIKPNCRMT